VIGVIADNEVIKIVTKKITSILSLNLSINILFLKRYGGINPSTISECQQKIIGERSAD
tara:strand:+ start:341 stop:517 length:177 start_codon:yes stop_codon:yes gene_type:complete